MLLAMLQRNTARHAHLAHAAVMGLHSICCGLPLVALALTAFAGATSGVVLFSESVSYFHALIHAHEGWILVVSAGLVVIGGWMEAVSRRHHTRGFPWMFAFSVCCFIANVTIIAMHRLG